MRTRFAMLFVLALIVAAPACSEDKSAGGPSGSGGSTGTGGASSGGSGGAGGSGGSTTSGSGGNAAAGSGGSGGGGADAQAGSDGGADVGTDANPTDSGGGDGSADAPTAFQFSCGGLVQMGDRLVFPPLHSAPVNQGPPFAWGTAPAGTMSIAITLSDRTNGNGHWAIWNIPPTETMLAANLPATMMPGVPAPTGARQSGGWAGPGGPNVNSYELRIWALKVPMYTFPANVAAMRNALLADFMGAKTMVLDSQVIMAAGTRGGIGANP